MAIAEGLYSSWHVLTDRLQRDHTHTHTVYRIALIERAKFIILYPKRAAVRDPGISKSMEPMQLLPLPLRIPSAQMNVSVIFL